MLDITGQIFGKLTALRLSPDSRLNKTIWLCKCACGKLHKVRLGNLRNGGTQSCGCSAGRNKDDKQRSHRWKGFAEISGTFWNRIKQGARSRHLEFSISIEEAWALFVKQDRQCALSGLSISFEKKNETLTQCTASLDRIDSKRGYTRDNIQWLHKDINIMKMDSSQEKFINYCRLVSERHKKCNISYEEIS